MGALVNNPACADLLGGYSGAMSVLHNATFSYAGTAVRPPGISDQAWAELVALGTNPGQVAARSTIGSDFGFLSDAFFQNYGNFSRAAALLIHEMMHMAGSRTEIDNQETYAEISEKCALQNPNP